MKDVLPVDEKNWLFSAQLDQVDLVCRDLVNFLSAKGLEAEIFAVELLVREALNNAVLHGSKEDPSMNVMFQVALFADCIELQIQDEGPGFDWQQKLELEPSPVDRSNGRGLWIYRYYAETVEFNPQGNFVRLVRKIQKQKKE